MTVLSFLAVLSIMLPVVVYMSTMTVVYSMFTVTSPIVKLGMDGVLLLLLLHLRKKPAMKCITLMVVMRVMGVVNVMVMFALGLRVTVSIIVVVT